jgi:hypothetical protein
MVGIMNTAADVTSLLSSLLSDSSSLSLEGNMLPFVPMAAHLFVGGAMALHSPCKQIRRLKTAALKAWRP